MSKFVFGTGTLRINPALTRFITTDNCIMAFSIPSAPFAMRVPVADGAANVAIISMSFGSKGFKLALDSQNKLLRETGELRETIYAALP